MILFAWQKCVSLTFFHIFMYKTSHFCIFFFSNRLSYEIHRKKKTKCQKMIFFLFLSWGSERKRYVRNFINGKIARIFVYLKMFVLNDNLPRNQAKKGAIAHCPSKILIYFRNEECH